jgi:inosine-uridine nucleoside N-ribohydrolase
MNNTHLPQTTDRNRLEPPAGVIRMVLDTDTYNEIDDQFAVVYALLSPERLKVEALYAAPFHNNRSDGPEDGMEKSYAEILRLLELLDYPAEGFVYRGSTGWLSERQGAGGGAGSGAGSGARSDAEQSPAALDLVERAMATPQEEPLVVVAIGAITNSASAILIEPEIIQHILVVWLGGQPHSLHFAKEFNLKQDLRASQLIFDCGVPLVHIPCQGVASHLLTSVPELKEALEGRNAVSDFLLGRFCAYQADHFAWAKEIWDIATIAYLLNNQWVPSMVVPSPVLTEQLTWAKPPAGRHVIRTAWNVHRNPVFADLLRKLQNFKTV